MADNTHDTDDDATRADRVMGREDEAPSASGGSTRRGSSRLSRDDYLRSDKKSDAQSTEARSTDAGRGSDSSSGAKAGAAGAGVAGAAAAGAAAKSSGDQKSRGSAHSDAGASGSSTSTTAANGADSSARTDDERTTVSNTTATRRDSDAGVDNERTQAIDTERTQAIDTERTRNQSRTQPAQDSSNERLYRDSDTDSGDAERTRVQPAPAAAAPTEADRDAERERRRREREQALGTRRKSDEVAETEPVRKPKRTTDKFFGAFGLFLLRLVVAAIMGGHGLTKLADIGSVQQMLSGQPLVPMPEYAAWVLAICEVLIAVAMVFGLAVRFAGLGTAIIAILALSLIKFAGMQFFEGYTLKGELELLLAAVGIMFLFVGGGSWGFDGMIRRRRAANKS